MVMTDTSVVNAMMQVAKFWLLSQCGKSFGFYVDDNIDGPVRPVFVDGEELLIDGTRYRAVPLSNSSGKGVWK